MAKKSVFDNLDFQPPSPVFLDEPKPARRSVFDYVYMPPPSPDSLMLFEETVLPQALAGDYEALTRVFYVCGEAIKHGCVLTPGLASLVSGGLRAMADGADGREAWPLRRGRGQKNTALAYSNATKWAFMVEIEREKGATYEKAVIRVADRECVSIHTVEAAWKKHHRKITKHPDGGMTLLPGPNDEE